MNSKAQAMKAECGKGESSHQDYKLCRAKETTDTLEKQWIELE